MSYFAYDHLQSPFKGESFSVKSFIQDLILFVITYQQFELGKTVNQPVSNDEIFVYQVSCFT
jgi:hypothetical protein